MDNTKFIYKNQSWVFNDYDLNNEIRIYENISKNKIKIESYNLIAGTFILSSFFYVLLGNNSNGFLNNFMGCLSGGTICSFMCNSTLNSIFSPITKRLNIYKNINRKTEELIDTFTKLLSEKNFQYSFLIYLEGLEMNLNQYHFHDPIKQRQANESLSELKILRNFLIHLFAQESYQEAATNLVNHNGIKTIKEVFTLLDKVNSKTAIEKEKLKIYPQIKSEVALKTEDYKIALNQFKKSKSENIVEQEQEFEYKKYL